MKNLYDLPSEFYHEWVDDLDSFLKDNPLNVHIYKSFQWLLAIVYNGEECVDSVEVFNEAIILCKKIIHDKYPDDNFNSKYGYLVASDANAKTVLTLYIAYVYLNIYDQLCTDSNVYVFLQNVEFFEWESMFKFKTKNPNNNLLEIDIHQHEEYKDCLPDFESDVFLKSPKSYNVDWEKVTDYFQKDSVLFVVKLWKTIEHRLEAVDCIESAYDYYMKHKDDLPF